jgi:hypothetical protein
MEKDEIIKTYPSICYHCENARNPASVENLNQGWVGCAQGCTNAKELNPEAKEIAEGWVDLKTMPFSEHSGIISNMQTLTKEVVYCSLYEDKT